MRNEIQNIKKIQNNILNSIITALFSEDYSMVRIGPGSYLG